jgi:uncharacterized protein (TIGR02687 family)
MKSEQVDQALREKFHTAGERLVFWHDPKGEFSEYIASGLDESLACVEILDLRQMGGLSAKIKIERQSPNDKFLVYYSGETFARELDWLLDIRQFSAEFRADIASLWQQELGLPNLSICEHLKKRSNFLKSKTRRTKLEKFIDARDQPHDLDRKMMAVLAGVEVAEFPVILRTICTKNLSSDGIFKLTQEPEVLAEIQKMDLSDEFWAQVEKEFSCHMDEPSFSKLLRQLFVSELASQIESAPLESLRQFVLPAGGARNASVFLTHWRDSSAHSISYDAVAFALEEELHISDQMSGVSLEELLSISTFWGIERRIASKLRDQVLTEKENVDVEQLKATVKDRQARHWLGSSVRRGEDRHALSEGLEAILCAAELFQMVSELKPQLVFDSAQELYSTYQDKLFRVDSLYRRFMLHAQPAVSESWDLLKKLSSEVEDLYSQSFLQPLGLECSRLLEDGFLSTWKVPGMKPQQGFYEQVVKRHLRESDRKRAFVIISDAFRYEAAFELLGELNGTPSVNAEITSMLGVLPSYTTLGMASLLPRETMDYAPNGDVKIDGKSVAGTKARSTQLGKVQGMAIQAEELLPLTQDQARQATEGCRVIYIYHNVVDSRGDKLATEGGTFVAVAECIAELKKLVMFCVNRLNASKVWVTADHGFLFQNRALDEPDRSALRDKPEGVVKSKKRYVLGADLQPSPEVHCGATSNTASTSEGMKFWVPRGANRFHFVGGARFVHGGAMPQEVVIPLITVTHARGKKREETLVRKVGLQVLGANHRITIPRFRFTILQTDAAGPRMKPVNIRAAVYDGSDPVTSVEVATFSSESGAIDDRKQEIFVELKSGHAYDVRKEYRFVVRDADTDAELTAVQVTIDRSFDADF